MHRFSILKKTKMDASRNMTDKRTQKAKEPEGMFKESYKSGKSVRVFCGEKRKRNHSLCNFRGQSGCVDVTPYKIAEGSWKVRGHGYEIC